MLCGWGGSGSAADAEAAIQIDAGNCIALQSSVQSHSHIFHISHSQNQNLRIVLIIFHNFFLKFLRFSSEFTAKFPPQRMRNVRKN